MINHKDDIMNQDIEDCVLLMPYNQGYWNDVPCGHWDRGEHLSDSSGTELHHILCEYVKYCRFGNFREHFTFVNSIERHISDVKSS